MYESPININYGKMEMQLEGDILRAVQEVGVSVDKDQLLAALSFDRNQYCKGYQDAFREEDVVRVVRCRDCKHYDNSEGIFWCKLNSKFFPGGLDWHGFPEDGFCSYGERKDDDIAESD